MMEPLSVVCWKWKPLLGTLSTKTKSAYTADDVNRLYAMVQKHLHMPFQMICVTDDAADIHPDIKIVPLWNEFRRWGGCFVRLGAFRRGIGDLFGPRFVSIDLDCVIVGDITPVFSRTEDFIIWGNHGGNVPYCGGLWMMKSGCRPQVYEKFNPKNYPVTRRGRPKGSDQHHISNTLSNEAMWTQDDGIYAFRRAQYQRLPENARIIFFNGVNHPKDPELLEHYPWLYEHYYLAERPVNMPSQVNTLLNIVCFYWLGKKGSGWDNIEMAPVYINRLYHGIRRNTTLDFNFICFIQEGLRVEGLHPKIEVRRFNSPVWHGCMPKFYAFSKEANLQGRVIIFDLDLIVVGNLTDILLYRGHFMTRSEPHGPNVSGGDIVFFQANTFKFWDELVKRGVSFNITGSERFFYRKKFGSKMDFLQTLFPGSILSYKVNLRRNGDKIPENCRLISCHGHPKPHELTDQRFIKEHWRDE